MVSSDYLLPDESTLWQAYAERLNAFGEYLLKAYGLKLAYHHHMGAYVESPADVDKLMASSAKA